LAADQHPLILRFPDEGLQIITKAGPIQFLDSLISNTSFDYKNFAFVQNQLGVRKYFIEIQQPFHFHGWINDNTVSIGNGPLANGVAPWKPRIPIICWSWRIDSEQWFVQLNNGINRWFPTNIAVTDNKTEWNGFAQGTSYDGLTRFDPSALPSFQGFIRFFQRSPLKDAYREQKCGEFGNRVEVVEPSEGSASGKAALFILLVLVAAFALTCRDGLLIVALVARAWLAFSTQPNDNFPNYRSGQQDFRNGKDISREKSFNNDGNIFDYKCVERWTFIANKIHFASRNP